MSNALQEQITQANDANMRSELPFRFHLVHAEQVNYTETTGNIDTDLDHLTNGAINNVHTLRDMYSADLVTLVGSGYQNYCGTANIMDNVGTGFASQAFSVIDVNTSRCDTLTLAHEMGHNMALRHDFAHNTDTNPSPFTYNYGYINTTAGIRTVMAYDSSACPGGQCAHIPHWSDPRNNYDSNVVGTATADNARALNNTNGTVEQFHNSSIGGTDGSLDPGAVSWGQGRIDLFIRGAGNALQHKYWDGNTWVGWDDLGGVLSSGPDAASWSSGRLDVFVLGTDNAIWHKWYDGSSGWGAWESLGGSMTSAPSAVSWGPGRIDIFAKGTDNALWHKWYDSAFGWGSWESLGGGLTSGPDAASWASGRIDVFVKGTDNALKHKWYEGGAWGAWEDLGGGLTSDPGAVSWSAQRIDVFVRGTDNALKHKSYVGPTGWGAWEDLGGGLSSGPDVSSWASGRLDVFVRGTDNAIWHRWYENQWFGWDTHLQLL
jgi:hypothetical protein